MSVYVAIVEEEPEKAVGVWFPDLPGCFSAGDSLDEALTNAHGALRAYADVVREENRTLPRARTLTELKSDPNVSPDLQTYMVALVPLDGGFKLRPAAE